MNKKIKKNLIEFGIIGGLLLTLFVTGLHTEVFGFLQRGILQTGLMDPDLDKKEKLTSVAEMEKADLNFSLVNSDGEKVNLQEFSGKIIFLNFWATWCPPCIAEMPGINRLHQSVDDNQVKFVMVSVDQDFEKAKKFKANKDYGFEIYRPAGPIPSGFSTRSIPTTYVIDPEGNVALTHLGMGDFDTEEFRDFLKKLQQ